MRDEGLVVKGAWHEQLPVWLELALVAGASAGVMLLRDWLATWLEL